MATDSSEIQQVSPEAELTFEDHQSAIRAARSVGMDAVDTGLEAEEAARARTIGLVFFLVCSPTACWAPLLDGDPSLKAPVALLVGLFALFGLYVFWLASVPERYTRRVFLVYGMLAVVASIMVLIYLGPFSPTALAVTLGISFFGQGADRRGAWLICGSAIVLCLSLYTLILTGLVADVGVFRGEEGGFSGRLFMTVMVPLVLLVTMMQAYWARQGVESALETAVESTMEASRRAVQLEEAQAELERIAAAGGMLGHMSGRTVGAYKLGPLLGRGGSGEVYDCVDSRDNSNVAVKVLVCNDLDGDNIPIRFQREGEIATQLVSPYVTRVYEYGRAAGGTLYIAMERMEGSDLAAILRRDSRLEFDEARELVHHVCQGISEAHRLGVIHRDIKPHNIFQALQADGSTVWKVLDFGVSKLAANFASITRSGVVGTPQYMSPEQARGEPVDVRADVYGVGAVLYRVLTGQPPMPGRNHTALFNAAFRRPVRPRLLVPEMSRQVEAVLALAMAPAPEGRFQTLELFRAAFDKAATGELPVAILQRASTVPWNTLRS
ncbi:MAG: hypothetical protein CMP23_05785 [Rickettsiales bacterium]|nr:hypothetical protein [Rickettsiales bacterium]|tara:strand:- start:1703 stop:3361 length:1659 start_codon:yes stop_codon:yes gene_type:complete